MHCFQSTNLDLHKIMDSSIVTCTPTSQSCWQTVAAWSRSGCTFHNMFFLAATLVGGFLQSCQQQNRCTWAKESRSIASATVGSCKPHFLVQDW